jgi:hypothetical protein
MKDNARKGLAITAGTITGISLTGLMMFLIGKASGFFGEKIIDVSFAVGEAIWKKGKTEEIVED